MPALVAARADRVLKRMNRIQGSEKRVAVVTGCARSYAV